MRDSWDLERGDEIVPGRSVVRPLGGGRRYEVFLVWDDRLFALVVAKVLRPHLAHEDRYREELREESQALGRLAHPVIVRGFDAVLDGPHPHVLIEHLEGPTLRQLIHDDDTNGGTGSDASGTDSNLGTGRETRGNTDLGGQNTGVSTVGETDGRDGTGPTERTQGTGRETRGDSDNGQDTGTTLGDTDGDGTDSNSANGTDTGDTEATATGDSDT